MSSVLIIGGGLAGLAAAASLAQRGLSVTVLESRPRLGGRASSFIDPVTGETIDNCQHVAMGCCTNFQAFCRLTGLENHFRTEDTLHFIGPDGRQYPWGAAPLPAPLHLMPAYFRLGYLTFRQKLTAARALRSLARFGGQPGESFADWLQRHRQPPELIERFWEVVLVSALSESMDRIDVACARKVFVDGFLAHRDGWKVIIPNQPFDEIYAPLQSWLREHGATVRLSTGVERIESDGHRAAAVVLRSGERLQADDVIVAVPWDRAASLLPIPLAASPTDAAPISSVHLWFDRPITNLPHAVFVGKTSQWLFQRKEKPLGGTSNLPAAVTQNDRTLEPVSHYYQIVVSASRGFLRMETADAIEHVRRELASLWPVVDEATLLRGRVVTEHKAVFSPVPGIDALRPPQATSLPNLHLAGDWTRTGWPATMEGAVKSGFLAAERVLERLGRSETLVVPGLQPGWLPRLTMGI